MLTDLIEIILSFIQYVAMILTTDGVNFPESWQVTSSFVALSNLQQEFFAKHTNFIPTDFRVYFVFVSVLIPLALIFLGLLALNSKKVVVWYFALLAGIVMVVVGALAAIIRASGSFDIVPRLAEVLIAIGGAL